jgi:hypothetical protein
LKWDGEWRVTYDTFRDMGIAYSVGLILIYLLVVAQFGSYWVPLVIMAPIPLTILGVMPRHALLGAQFTATSMIGMIALAGINVRNSILLVDFIHQELAAGATLASAVVRAEAVRAKPIALTALAEGAQHHAAGARDEMLAHLVERVEFRHCPRTPQAHGRYALAPPRRRTRHRAHRWPRTRLDDARSA